MATKQEASIKTYMLSDDELNYIIKGTCINEILWKYIQYNINDISLYASKISKVLNEDELISFTRRFTGLNIKSIVEIKATVYGELSPDNNCDLAFID